MENNGKELGIFYGVIGVATLIVTIIGATFAFFSAEAGSDAGAVSATGAKITLEYDDIKTGQKTKLIPINVSLPQFNTGGFVGIEDKCVDINGSEICSVYQFTVTNPDTSTSSQRVYGSITPTENTFTNFAFAVFKGTSAQVDANSKEHTYEKTVVADATVITDYDTQIHLSDAQDLDGYDTATVGSEVQVTEKIGWDVDGTIVESLSTTATEAERKNIIADVGDLVYTTTGTDASGNSLALVKGNKNKITIPAWEQILDKGESVTYTIVMWIPEINAEQDADQEAKFKATVNFTTADGGSGVTGVLSASQQ